MNRVRHPALIWPGLCVLALANHAAAQPAPTVVSPTARASLEGSASTFYPLGRARGRYQQLYQDLGAARMLKGHAYRRDSISSRAGIAGFRSEMLVQLSAAALSPAKASRTFASNSGSSPSTVLPRTILAFPASTKPTSAPGPFVHKIPYKTPFSWTGSGSLCLEMVLYGNQTGSGQDKNFSADLDAHELFSSRRNLQPAFRFGKGCGTPAASASFLVRHLGKTADLQLQLKNGMPTTSKGPGRSLLVLGFQRRNRIWPPSTGCTIYNELLVVLYLPGANDSKGGWTGSVGLGTPVSPGTSMIGQMASFDAGTGVVLSNAGNLIMPPPGPGLVAARIANGTSSTATTGTLSYAVPVTQFF